MAQATIDTTVAGLQGVPISPQAPTNGQALMFNGTVWIPTNPQVGLPLSGGTLTGPLVLSGNATAALNPVTLQQLQANYLLLTGGTVTGALTVNGQFSSPYSGPFSLSGANAGITIPAAAPGGYINVGGNIYAGGTISSGGSMSSGGAISNTGANNITSSQHLSAARAVYANGVDGGSYGNYGLIANPGGLWVEGASYIGGGLSLGTSNFGTGGEILSSSTSSGAIAANAGNMWAQYDITAYRNLTYFGSLINGSDPKLKKNITPAEPGALAIVLEIPVKHYQLNDDEPHTGFLATDVAKVRPDMVITTTKVDTEEKFLAIHSNDMVAILWQAVQELAAKVQGAK